jgi:hypothetical protein
VCPSQFLQISSSQNFATIIPNQFPLHFSGNQYCLHVQFSACVNFTNQNKNKNKNKTLSQNQQLMGKY